jgi:plant 4,4-dimethylsterol C-4alpha-methyl-monooxygenase
MMIEQYPTVADAEAALGRALTWAETMWYEYSAAMPDYWLYSHTTIIVFVVYTLAPLPLLLLETFVPALVLPYKLQPKVLLPPAVSLRCYTEAAMFFVLALPSQIFFHPAVAKVSILLLSLSLSLACMHASPPACVNYSCFRTRTCCCLLFF